MIVEGKGNALRERLILAWIGGAVFLLIPILLPPYCLLLLLGYAFVFSIACLGLVNLRDLGNVMNSGNVALSLWPLPGRWDLGLEFRQEIRKTFPRLHSLGDPAEEPRLERLHGFEHGLFLGGPQGWS